MRVPGNFIHVSEVRLEWRELIAKMPAQFRQYLSEVDYRLLGTISSNFVNPILAIPHKDYVFLNLNISLVASICRYINTRMVHNYSGVQFIKPPEKNTEEVLLKIMKEFDAEINDIKRRPNVRRDSIT